MSSLFDTSRRLARRIGGDDRLLFAAVAIAVLLTRIPFLGVGFGRDPDAWRLVYAGIETAESGRYVASRLPGFPLPEFAYALLYKISALNFPLVPILSALAVALFVVTSNRLGCRHSLLAGAALAFTPIVYLSSTNAMDYTWTLAAVLAAYYFLVRGRALVAGVLCGVAIATRLTAGAMLVPFAIVLAMAGGAGKGDQAKLWLPALGLGALFYIPGAVEHGFGLFEIVDRPRPLGGALVTLGPQVWGEIGVVAVLVALVVVIARRLVGQGGDRVIAPPRGHVVAWIVAAVLYVIIFLRLPHEAGYLILFVPFMIWILANGLSARVFAVLCGLIVVSSFVTFDRSGLRPGTMLESNWVCASLTQKSREVVAEAYQQESDKVGVIVSWMVPQVRVIQALDPSLDRSKEVRFLFSMKADSLEAYTKRGWYIYTVSVGHRPTFPGLGWYASRFAHPVFVDWRRLPLSQAAKDY